MRNFIKPAGSPARHRARGLAAVVASVALAAGLGAYPAVQAEETTTVSDIPTDAAGLPTYSWMDDGTPSSSATPSAPAAASASNPASASASKPAGVPATANPVTVERKGDIDRIVVNDPEGEAWEFGGKASKENIFALQREGKGKIKEVLSVTADGRKLEGYDYGFVNSADGGFVAFNLNALHTIPPQVVEIEVRTTAAGEYAIAESDEVPSEAELAESGYGKGRPAEDDRDDDQLRAGPATAITGHPGQIDHSLSFQKVSETYKNRQKVFKLKLTEPGNWKLTQFRIAFPDNTSGESLSDKPEIWVGDSKQNYSQLPVYNTKKNRYSVVYDRTYLTLNSGGAAEGPNWNFNGPEIKVNSGGEITFVVGGPNRPDYTIEIRGQKIREDGTIDATDTDLNDIYKFKVEGDGLLIKDMGTGKNQDKSYTSRGEFLQDSKFERAYIDVYAPNSILAVEHYSFESDGDIFEPGVQLGQRVIRRDSNHVAYEVFPMIDGERVSSVNVRKGAKMKFSSKFSDAPKFINSKVTIVGTPLENSAEPQIPPLPEGSQTFPSDGLIAPTYPNPPLPKKCGLKVAIVADLSNSLVFADKNGFEASKEAANGLLSSLVGTPTKVGIYSFGDRARQNIGPTTVEDPANPGKVNSSLTGAINQWKSPSGLGGATNWESGLKIVENENYDVVYFITDGLPTSDNDTWQRLQGKNPADYNYGSFVQRTSFNRAVVQADHLKKAGTRIVPLMVDLTLGDRFVVKQDYILKDLLDYRVTDKGQRAFVTNSKARSPHDTSLFHLPRARYVDPGKTRVPLKDAQGNDRHDAQNVTDILANAEQALQDPNSDVMYFTKNKEYGVTGVGTATFKLGSDLSEFVIGPRSVRQMGEDISGPGDTVRVREYSKLAEQLAEVGKEINRLCAGKVIVKKQIVDKNRNLLVDNAANWDFKISSTAPLVGTSGGSLSYSDVKTTGIEKEGAVASEADNQASVTWGIDSEENAKAEVVEFQQDGHQLMPTPDGKNAKCTSALGSEVKEVDVTNVGEPNSPSPGFEVAIDSKDGQLATVTCTVQNWKEVAPQVALELQKIGYEQPNQTLQGVEFQLTGEDEEPIALTFDTNSGVFRTESVLKPEVTYTLIETKAPEGYSLLVEPIIFRLHPVEGSKKFGLQFKRNGTWVDDQTAGGLYVTQGEDKVVMQVANVRQGNLPKTGGAGLLAPITAGFMVVGLGIALGNRRQRV